LNFEYFFFVIGNSIKLQKIILEGKFSCVGKPSHTWASGTGYTSPHYINKAKKIRVVFGGSFGRVNPTFSFLFFPFFFFWIQKKSLPTNQPLLVHILTTNIT
jgi:hypothetical protein